MEKWERIEVIRARSKAELYQQLFEQAGGHYYHIVDQQIKRKPFFFWRKAYEMTVKYVVQEEFDQQLQQKEDHHNTTPLPVEREENKPNNKVQSILDQLEKGLPKQEDSAPLQRRDSEKKQQFLKLLEQGITIIPEKEETSPQQAGAMEKLQQEIETLHEKLKDASRQEPHPIFIEKFAYILRENDVEERLINVYMKKVQKAFQDADLITDLDIRNFLINEMATHLKTGNPLQLESNRVMILLGPTGVGKTTTIAKLGWQLRQKERTVGFITTDVLRPGAVPQLQQYVEKLDAELLVAESEEALKAAIDYFTNVNPVDHILVDTIGKSYKDADSVASLDDYISILQPDLICLTVSAVTRSKDVFAQLSHLEHLHIDGLLVTKLDEASGIGELLTVSRESNVPILFVTNGQDFTKHIYLPTSHHLAERILRPNVVFKGDIFQ
ncbi:hypothetical protein ACFDTO_15420 [Microbacteriaceae bacterium 4G12]